MPTIDWKWNCLSCLSDYPIICLSIWLLIEMKIADYQLEMKGLVERPCDQRVCWKCCTLLELRDSAGWSAFSAAKNIEKWKCRSWLTIEKNAVLVYRSCLTVPVNNRGLDACVSQYQYWSGKERSRGKNGLNFPRSVRKAEGPVDHALYQKHCLSFLLWSELTTKSSRTMATILNSVHLDLQLGD